MGVGQSYKYPAGNESIMGCPKNAYYYSGSSRKIFKEARKNERKTAMENLLGWGDNQMVTVVVDCEKWKLVIFVDDKYVGECAIQKNKVYYPAMYCDSFDDASFQLFTL